MRIFLVIFSAFILNSCSGPQKSTHRGMAGMEGMAPEGAGTLEACAAAKGFGEHVSPAQQNVINQVVGHRGHRLLHALWHANRSGLTTQEIKQEVQAYGNSWKDEHKYCPPPENNANSSNYNPVGEDFLYMHRLMIESIRAGMIAQGLQCVAGWSQVPDPKIWPLPDRSIVGSKSPKALAELKTWDSKLQDPAWLKTVSLSQLGMAIEISTHNNLHMRYATTKPPGGFPGVEKTGGAPIPFDGKFVANWPYDDFSYNWLADPYGAALNPTFWKIHGYVDSLIDKWLAANNYKSISENCAKGDSTCYRWRGTWTGEVPSYLDVATKSREALTASASPTDSRTTNFNQERMRKQWVGVIGGDPSQPPRASLPKNGEKAIPAQDSADPFEYAVSQECGGK